MIYYWKRVERKDDKYYKINLIFCRFISAPRNFVKKYHPCRKNSYKCVSIACQNGRYVAFTYYYHHQLSASYSNGYKIDKLNNKMSRLFMLLSQTKTIVTTTIFLLLAVCTEQCVVVNLCAECRLPTEFLYKNSNHPVIFVLSALSKILALRYLSLIVNIFIIGAFLKKYTFCRSPYRDLFKFQ